MVNAPPVGPLRGSIALKKGASYLKVEPGGGALCPSTATLMLCPVPEPAATVHEIVSGLEPTAETVHLVDPMKTLILFESVPTFEPMMTRV
jgi:hypothetical protein